MIGLGARHIVPLLRSGASSKLATEMVKEPSENGAALYVESCDVSNGEQMRRVLRPYLVDPRWRVNGAL